jgi:hypothetical protein
MWKQFQKFYKTWGLGKQLLFSFLINWILLFIISWAISPWFGYNSAIVDLCKDATINSVWFTLYSDWEKVKLIFKAKNHKPA